MRLRSQLGRRGRLTNEQLVKLLIILISVALVMFFLLRIKDIATKNADGECAAEVRKAHLVNKAFTSEAAIDIENCQTRYVTVNEDDLGPRTAPEHVKQERAKRILADEMLQCWREWGKGELNLFGEYGEYCHVCSVVEFNETHELKDFDVYLQNTSIPGRSINYTQELTGYDSGDIASVEKLSQGNYNVVTDKPYMVVFRYGRYSNTQGIRDLLFEVGPDGFIRSTLAGTVGFSVGLAGLKIAAVAGAVVSAPVTIAVAGGATLAAMMIVQGSEDIYVLSGTYLIPQTPEQLEYHGCEKAATVTRSP